MVLGVVDPELVWEASAEADGRRAWENAEEASSLCARGEAEGARSKVMFKSGWRIRSWTERCITGRRCPL